MSWFDATRRDSTPARNAVRSALRQQQRVLEELLILSHLQRRKRGKSFLDGRVLVGSMTRGGLAGTAAWHRLAAWLLAVRYPFLAFGWFYFFGTLIPDISESACRERG